MDSCIRQRQKIERYEMKMNTIKVTTENHIKAHFTRGSENQTLVVTAGERIGCCGWYRIAKKVNQYKIKLGHT